MSFEIVTTKAQKDYELLDSGEGEKLERFGSIIISRPDPQALWSKKHSKKEWAKAQAIFSREEKANWKLLPNVPERWEIEFAGLHFWIKPTAFKHTGLFPEQAENWKWMQAIISQTHKNNPAQKFSILNLFGYTGGATLAALKAGAEVVHVDASRSAINWAKENAVISGLSDKPVRWILDDARAFLKREIKRGNTYDGIIMDPPAFGHGPKGELWKIEEHFLELVDMCAHVLSQTPTFFLINGYASGYSAITYQNTLNDLMKGKQGTTTIGELTLEESGSHRLLPAGIFARWEADSRI